MSEAPPAATGKSRSGVPVAGVTGHRDPGLDPVAPSLLAERVDGTLRALAAAGVDTLVSPLAEGADRLVARRALDAGWTLRALLPFPATRYEDDFRSEASRDEFRLLLERSSEVEVVGQDDPGNGNAELAYRRVGEALLQRCGVLLAIWDGDPPRGPGGTAEVVSQAREKGIPVIWIDSASPHTVRTLDPVEGSEGEAPALPPGTLSSWLGHWLAPSPHDR